MRCDVLFFYNKNDCGEIDKLVQGFPKPLQVITSSYDVNEFLKKRGINSASLRDIFAEEGDNTYEIHNRSKKIQAAYRRLFQNITFLGFDIFSGIENQLLDQIILLEKIKNILENRINTIFIFENFSFSYFAILKATEDFGYDNNQSIGLLRGNTIKFMEVGENQTLFEIRNKFNHLKKIFFPSLVKRKFKIKYSFPKLPVFKLFAGLFYFSIKKNKKILPSESFLFDIITTIKKIKRKMKLVPAGIIYAKYVPSIVYSNIKYTAIRGGRFSKNVPSIVYSNIKYTAIRGGRFSKNVPSIVYSNIKYTLIKFSRKMSYICRILLGPFRIPAFLIKISILRSARIMGIETTKIIFNKINNKISSSSAGYFAKSAFFFTTNQEDLYLKSLYPILEKFRQEKVGFHVFTIDMITEQVLMKKNVSYMSLFDEVNILADMIKKSREGKKLLNDIENVAIKNDIYLLFNRQLSTYFASEICRSAAILLIIEHIISQLKLKSAIIAVDGTTYGNCVIAITNKHKIPSYFIPSTIINANPLHADWYHANKICLYGLQGLETLPSLGYNKKRLILTGNPKYDFLKSIDPIHSKQILEKNFKIDKTKKLVVIGMARWHKNDESWMSDLIHFCNKNDYEIIVKIHPMYKNMLYSESEEKIKIINKKCEGLKYLITYDAELYTLLSAADLVITDYSNVGVDAILLEKPLLTMNFVKQSLTNEQRYHEYGAAIHFEEYTKLEDTIIEILDKKMHLDKLAEGRKRIVDMYNIYNDGNSTQRIFDLLINKELPRIVVN